MDGFENSILKVPKAPRIKPAPKPVPLMIPPLALPPPALNFKGRASTEASIVLGNILLCKNIENLLR